MQPFVITTVTVTLKLVPEAAVEGALTSATGRTIARRSSPKIELHPLADRSAAIPTTIRRIQLPEELPFWGGKKHTDLRFLSHGVPWVTHARTNLRYATLWG